MNSSINCSIPQTFTDLNEFLECYRIHFEKNILYSVLSLLLAFCSFFFNALVIALIKRNTLKINTFDQILIGHAVVDGLTGLIDIPFYHLFKIFGYWPLGEISAKLWASYDNSINTITNMHMLYLSFSRLRCIKNVKNYQNELLLKSPADVMILIWLFSLIIWTPQVFFFGLRDYSLELNIDSLIHNLLNLIFFWFLPILSILIVSCVIFYYLRMKQIRRQHLNENNENRQNRTENKKSLCLKASKRTQSVFTLIMTFYWIQWFIPCVFRLIYFLKKIEIANEIYWLTYTVCLTDPLILLLFNPKVSIFHKNPHNQNNT